jgi:hypothetical protein
VHSFRLFILFWEQAADSNIGIHVLKNQNNNIYENLMLHESAEKLKKKDKSFFQTCLRYNLVIYIF